MYMYSTLFTIFSHVGKLLNILHVNIKEQGTF